MTHMTPGAEIVHERIARKLRGPKGLGASMAGGNPNATRGRSANDFYATPDDTTDALLARWGHLVTGVVWEPCAGNGKLAARVLRHPKTASNISKLIATDIEPRPQSEWHYPIAQIGKLDLFGIKARGPEYADRRFDTIITNPPFDIAADIIEHIFTVGEPHVRCMMLLLKATFWHAKTRLPLFRAFPPSVIAPLTFRPDFLDPAYRKANPDVAGPTMELAWFIWIAGNTSTHYDPLERANV